MEMVSVLEFHAKGNGIFDDSQAFQAALDSGVKKVYIPQGKYKISRTLRVHSNTVLLAEPNAHMVMDGEMEKKCGDFLLTNADHENGNCNIKICGGIWDGNNAGRCNTKGDIFDLTGYSGCVLNFFHVTHLVLDNMIVANSVTYNIRMARIQDFSITNIGFLSDAPAFNQDGLHFNGFVKDGTVRNIQALSNGQTNDDFIALNADDAMNRVEEVGMVCGDIENITFENIYAENCHTVIRLLSVQSAIRNITIKNVYAGFRCNAINADAARYCRTPLFEEKSGVVTVGNIEKVCIENMTCFKTGKKDIPAIIFESAADCFEMKRFTLLAPTEEGIECPALSVSKIENTTIVADDKTVILQRKDESVQIKNFTELKINQSQQ